MVCGKPLYFFKITVVPPHFHCLSAVCICSVIKIQKKGFKNEHNTIDKPLVLTEL